MDRQHASKPADRRRLATPGGTFAKSRDEHALQPSAAPVESSVAGERFAAIDALRGIAAVWVAAFHFYLPLRPVDEAARSALAEATLGHGYLGVPIFFVLSGFVIARNFYKLRVTGDVVGRFALRRSIRLDPTYWAVIVMTLGVEWLKYRRGIGQGQYFADGFSAVGVAANFFYLNDLLQYPAIVMVGWTLCLEIQFYLVFAALMWLETKWGDLFDDAGRAQTATLRRTLLFAPLAVTSLLLLAAPALGPLRSVTEFRVPGLFVEHWFAFCCGAAAWWCYAGEWTTKRLYGYLGAVLGVVALLAMHDFSGHHVRMVEAGAAVATALFIHVLGVRGRLRNTLSGPVLQFLGRISYSLYLVHTVVATRVLRYAFHLSANATAPSLPVAAGFFLLAFAITIPLAYALYRIVERPTQRWSRKVPLTA